MTVFGKAQFEFCFHMFQSILMAICLTIFTCVAYGLFSEAHSVRPEDYAVTAWPYCALEYSILHDEAVLNLSFSLRSHLH